jgi:hypothetical protein
MRVTADHVPTAPRERTIGIPVPKGEALWLALAMLGSGAVAIADIPLVTIGGIAAVGMACYRLGIGSRTPDPRVEALTRDRDAWRQRALAAAVAAADLRPAPAGDGAGGPAEGARPRPSAGIRGGGRPGAVNGTAATPGAAAGPGEDADA